MSNQATKARLLSTIIPGFERRVNQSIRHCESHPEASFADLESKARQLSHGCFAAVLEAEVEMRRQAAEEAPRYSCGRLLAYKGDQVRQLETYVGRITLRRGYYYCEACRKGCYPWMRPWASSQASSAEGFSQGYHDWRRGGPFRVLLTISQP